MQRGSASGYTPSFKGSEVSSPMAHRANFLQTGSNVAKARRIFLGSSSKKAQEVVSQDANTPADIHLREDKPEFSLNKHIQDHEGKEVRQENDARGSYGVSPSYTGDFGQLSSGLAFDQKYSLNLGQDYIGSGAFTNSYMGLGNDFGLGSQNPVAPISIDYNLRDSTRSDNKKTTRLSLRKSLNAAGSTPEVKGISEYFHFESSGTSKMLEEANKRIFELESEISKKDMELNRFSSAGHLLGNAEKVVSALKERVQELEHENEELASRGTIVVTDPDSQKMINELRREKSALEIKVTEMQKEIDLIHSSRGDFSHDLGQTRLRLEETLQSCEKLRIEKEEAIRRQETLFREKNHLEMELQELRLQHKNSTHLVKNKIPVLESQVLSMINDARRKEEQIESHEVEMSKIHSLEEALRELMHENEKLRESDLSIQAEFERVTRELSQKNVDVSSLKRDFLDAQERAANNLKEATKFQRENEKLRRTVTRLEDDIRSKEKIMEDADCDGSRTKSLTSQLEEMRRAVKHLEQENGDLRYDADNDQKRVNSLTLLVEEKKKEIEDLVEVARSLKAQLDKIKVRHDGLANDQPEIMNRYKTLEKANHTISAQNAHLTHLNANLEHSLEDYREQVKVWTQKFGAVEERLAFSDEMEIKMTGLARENMNLTNQIQLLTKKLEEYDIRLIHFNDLEEQLRVRDHRLLELEDHLRRSLAEREKAEHLIDEHGNHTRSVLYSHEENIRNLRNELGEVSADREHLLMKIEHLSVQISQFTQIEVQCRNLEELVRQKEAVITELEEKLGVLSEKFLSMQRTLELKSQFEGEVQRCKALIEDLETKLEMVLQENSQLNEALTLQENEHRRIVDVHQKEINEIHQKVQIILRENDQMKESLRRHEEERMQLALVIKRLEEENSRFEELLRSKGMTIEQITTELKESRERNAKGEMRFGDYQNELLRDIDALKRENNRLLEVVESQRREISELNGRMLRNIEDVKMARSYLGDMKSSRTEVGLTSRIGWDRNLDENERTVGRHRGLDLSERINLTLRK